jgi:hypothetical protein
MMAAVDFLVELTRDEALIRCLTAGARSVAYELDRDDACPARLAIAMGECLLTVPADDLEDLVADLECWGYEVQLPEVLRAPSEA